MKKNFRAITLTIICTLTVVYVASRFMGYNLTEQTGTFQLGSLFPFVIFLLCPLMHLFIMRSHGGHGGGCCSAKGDTAEDSKNQDTKSCHCAKRLCPSGCSFNRASPISNQRV